MGDTLWHTGDGTDVRFSALTIGLILEHLCARVRDAGAIVHRPREADIAHEALRSLSRIPCA